MAYESFKDAAGDTKYRKATGAGTTGDPSALHNIVDSSALPTGAATQATLAAAAASLVNIETEAVSGNLQEVSTATVQMSAVLNDWNDANRLKVVQHGATLGGGTPYKLVSAATTNATSVKASAGQLSSIIVGNVGDTVAYLKFYNKASAPTVGTDAPVHTIMIPSGEGGMSIAFPVGLQFSTGIALAITGAAADSDTTAVALDQVTVNLSYT